MSFGRGMMNVSTRKWLVWVAASPLVGLLLYILSFGPMDAFVIRTQDYMGHPDGAELPESGGIVKFYDPLVSTFDRAKLLPVLVSYVNVWYALRQCVTGPFGCESPYTVPSQKESNVDPSLQHRSPTNSSNKRYQATSEPAQGAAPEEPDA